jgi:hypothetical protein
MTDRLNPHARSLNSAESAALPASLLAAIRAESVVLINAPHPLARLRLWLGGGAVILVRGRRIFWPGLSEDLSEHPARIALLAHELTHVWQYQSGMTVWRYLWREIRHLPHLYAYDLIPHRRFIDYGYEQQAAMVEDWVRLRLGLSLRWGSNGVDAAGLEAVLPFADPNAFSDKRAD